MKRWANEGRHGPHPMTPALQVEIRTDLNQARIKMIYAVALAVLSVVLTIGRFRDNSAAPLVLGGGLALSLMAFLMGYFKVIRIRRYLSKHGVSLESVKGP